ncbi:hypothetical protein [Megamonas funiformis]|uniref:hypothetical protein n=1 Tax=Megamonas funiformis TaxID=437897 RepID=UPI003FEE8E8F
MSEWNDMILTQKGLNLQAKVEAGKCELELLRVELGSGTPEEAENIQELTALKKHEINVGISDKTPKDGGICTITGIITNQDVNIGFYAKEMGVIAKDPDAGEILYMYATDNNPDFVPAKTSKYVVNASYNIDVAISNAEMINATIDSAGLVTVSILNHYIENHNESNTTHTNLFKTLFNITEVNATKIKDKIKSYGKEVVQELFGITSATTDNLKNKIKEWAQEQINSWLETLGIRYNIAQNGYICLGKLFGGLILQWGMSEYTSLQANVDNTIKYPITITEVYCLIPFLKHGWKERAFAGTPFYINDLFNSYFKMAVTKEITANSWFYWVIIGL